jgi:hypothetical protein
MSKKLTRTSRSVAHHSPGRTRLKVPRAQRHNLRQIKENLSGSPGINSVEINQKTGSILVHHDHDTPIFDILHEAVETVGADLLTTLIEGETAELLAPAGILAAGVGLVVGFGKSLFSIAGSESASANHKPVIPVAGADLKLLVPAAFLAAAIYKAYQTRSFWQGLTPMALTYWAFDTYWKFNVVAAGKQEAHHDRNCREHKQVHD